MAKTESEHPILMSGVFSGLFISSMLLDLLMPRYIPGSNDLNILMTLLLIELVGSVVMCSLTATNLIRRKSSLLKVTWLSAAGLLLVALIFLAIVALYQVEPVYNLAPQSGADQTANSTSTSIDWATWLGLFSGSFFYLIGYATLTSVISCARLEKQRWLTRQTELFG